MPCHSTLRAVCLAFTFIFSFSAPGPVHAGTADAIMESKRPSPLADANTDRPGQDLRGFNLNTTNPNDCEAACAGDRKCKAWTYVKPGVQGAKARCWLKRDVPPPRQNNCCVSGLKAGICDTGIAWDAKARLCQNKVN
jgi:hypothetical protein